MKIYIMNFHFSDAALGTSVEVPSIDGGKTKIKIPSELNMENNLD